MYEGIDSISQMISGVSAQQRAITTNIANANTPGYTRQTVSFSDVMGNLSNPYETDLSHKMGSAAPGNMAQSTGQPVNISQELVEMQKVFLNYTLVTRRATTIFNNIRRATQIGR